MTDIKFLKNRIIIDGHADTKQECETITLLCDNLTKSKDFKTVRYESGYAEFVKVGKAEELKFISAPPTDVNCVIEFDSGITSVSCENGSSTVTWTTSNSSQSLTVAGELSTAITFTPIFKSGYELESVTAIVDKETIYAVTMASDKKSFSVDVEQRDFTLTITTKQSGSSGETWVFNETPQLPFSPTTQTFITNFTSNGGSYGRIDINNPAPDGKEAIYYNATPVLDSGLSWIDEGYRTIILEQSATGDLLAMLTKAAVKQTAISKQQIDLSTLSGWANLASGQHSITVKAKASGYGDSASSNAVSVEKAASGHAVTITAAAGSYGVKIYDGTSSSGTLLGTIADQDNTPKTVTCASGNLYLISDNGAYTDANTVVTGGITIVSEGSWYYNGTFKVTADGTITISLACLIEGTQITLADGTTKAIEDITYDDELLVWNFYEGKFDKAKPTWIKVAEVAPRYNLVKFSNGADVGFVGAGGEKGYHRIFNKEAGAFTHTGCKDTPNRTTTFTQDETFPTVVSQEVVEKEVKFYNVITDKHYNLFANGILTSCRLSNKYRIKDMRYIGEKLISDEQEKAYFERIGNKRK